MRENNIQEVICRYDFSSDILGVKSNKNFQYFETVEMDDGLLLDFDADNVPVSLEILDASKRFNLTRESLKNIIFFKMEVSIDEPLNKDSDGNDVVRGFLDHSFLIDYYVLDSVSNSKRKQNGYNAYKQIAYKIPKILV